MLVIDAVAHPRGAPAQALPRRPVGFDKLRAVHFGAGGVGQYPRVALQLEGDPLGQVGDADLELPGGGDAVEMGIRCRGGAIAIGRRVVAGHQPGAAVVVEVEGGRRHRQRVEEVRLEIRFVRLVRSAPDDFAQQSVGEIGVLPGAVLLNHYLGSGQRRQDLVAGREAQGAPAVDRRFGRQPRAVGQHAPQRHALEGAGADLHLRKFRDVLHQRVVEREFARIAQLHDGRGGKGLGYRGDASQRVGARRLGAGEVSAAIAAKPRQPAIADDAQGDARQAIAVQGLPGERFDLWDGVGEGGVHRVYLSVPRSR